MILDYLEDFGHISFDGEKLNDVDLLIFSQLAYFDFPEISTGEMLSLSKALSHMCFDSATDSAHSQERFAFQSRDDEKLRLLCTDARRYERILIRAFKKNYNQTEDKQFGGLCLELPEGTLVVAFRGTDTSLVGWREDCKLALDSPIPSQLEALSFLEQCSGLTSGPLLVCGHSKGGNLGIYAATFCKDECKVRIFDIVNFDGPGMPLGIAESDEYRSIENKIRVVMPKASIIGLLFEQPDTIVFVESSAKSLRQHYPYHWKTDKMGFLVAPTQSNDGRILASATRNFIENLSLTERKQFIELIFRLLDSSNSETIPELCRDWAHKSATMAKALFEEEPEERRLFNATLASFWKSVSYALGSQRDEGSVGAAPEDIKESSSS